MSTWYYANTIKKMQDSKRCACKTAVYYPIHVFCCDAKVKFGEYSEPGYRLIFLKNYDDLLGNSQSLNLFPFSG